MNAKKVEKALNMNYEYMKWRPWIKLPRIGKIQLGGIKVKYCTDMLRGSSQSGLIPIKDKNGPTINDKERVKER